MRLHEVKYNKSLMRRKDSTFGMCYNSMGQVLLN